MGIALILISISLTVAWRQSIKVSLLDTRCPPPLMDRFGPSTLVGAGDQKLLFDAGRGALQRFRQLGVRWQDVGGVFLTHMHSGHVVGFPYLWLTRWIVPPGQRTPLRVWGRRAPGTRRYTSDRLINSTSGSDSGRPSGARRGRAHDGGGAGGVVYDQGGVKVIAFEVDHSR